MASADGGPAKTLIQAAHLNSRASNIANKEVSAGFKAGYGSSVAGGNAGVGSILAASETQLSEAAARQPALQLDAAVQQALAGAAAAVDSARHAAQHMSSDGAHLVGAI
jgi:hypothetical protein